MIILKKKQTRWPHLEWLPVNVIYGEVIGGCNLPRGLLRNIILPGFWARPFYNNNSFCVFRCKFVDIENGTAQRSEEHTPSACSWGLGFGQFSGLEPELQKSKPCVVGADNWLSPLQFLRFCTTRKIETQKETKHHPKLLDWAGGFWNESGFLTYGDFLQVIFKTIRNDKLGAHTTIIYVYKLWLIHQPWAVHFCVSYPYYLVFMVTAASEDVATLQTPD